MYSLGSRSDFFSSHEEVVGTGEVVVVGARHRVERAGCFRVSVKEIQVSSVFLTNYLSQFTFHFCWKIFHHVPFNSVFIQKFHSFFECQLRNRFDESERFERELFVYCFKFVLETRLKVFENIREHICESIHQLMVVFFNHHFQIHSCKFTQMSVSMTVLSSEDWSNFKHSLKITHNSHLFVELRRLGQTSSFAEIIQFEHIWATFRCSPN